MPTGPTPPTVGERVEGWLKAPFLALLRWLARLSETARFCVYLAVGLLGVVTLSTLAALNPPPKAGNGGGHACTGAGPWGECDWADDSGYFDYLNEQRSPPPSGGAVRDAPRRPVRAVARGSEDRLWPAHVTEPGQGSSPPISAWTA